MKKKALFLCSSPRKDSNTNKIVGIVENLFKQRNIQTEVVDVANLEYKTNGCIDCCACQILEKFECVIEDEASEILKKIPQYDFLIFVTPVYFFGPNAQLKLFLDRMQCLYKFKETGTVNCINHLKIGLISTAGGSANLGLNLLDETMKTMCKYTKVPYASLLVPKVQEKDLNGKEIFKKAEDFAVQLLLTN